MQLLTRTCAECGHNWIARTVHLPQRCPSCRARRWLRGIPTFAERFWSKVEKGAGCWEWKASRYPSGYGQFRVGKTNRNAARVSWELTNGPVSDGLFVLHHCDNRPCVRPDHLFLGSNGDNMADMVSKGRAVFGERSPRAKVTWTQVRKMRQLWSSGHNQQELAAIFHISDSQIGNIVHGRSWPEEHRPRPDPSVEVLPLGRREE